jgi:hypothetical protein
MFVAVWLILSLTLRTRNDAGGKGSWLVQIIFGAGWFELEQLKGKAKRSLGPSWPPGSLSDAPPRSE